jgi:hypothetical protein
MRQGKSTVYLLCRAEDLRSSYDDDDEITEEIGEGEAAEAVDIWEKETKRN